ncbi:HpcH/HpaI aldolase/citrate lyase family protein [Halomonas sp. SL1]|uniref:HpcH/HpaI aldolase family protein n=1 Tax=Halomonas sp. SL1 TaxID=2137478 RepID=UPI000D17A3CF|nr:HpcH/HpaI aldolase/citrate lyase family protein [Halomonas sp. SL1]RAH38396.1 2-dehydro-3-deoxyglucarate aldolase [Halomonas sp. SL1]
MEVARNPFKAALSASRIQYGIWAGFGSAYCAEITASTGYDWMLIDGEHAPNTVTSILAQLQAVAPYPTASVVRTPQGDDTLIKQLLDIGTQTLMIPMVESAEQAGNIVRAMRYPPQGIRGVGGGLIRASRWNEIDDYMAHAHEELCLIAQIETSRGVENVEAIAKVDGVDALFIGPYDLSASLGYPGNPQHPDVQGRIRHCIESILAAGKTPGILAPNAADANHYAQLGCRFIAVGIDVSLLRQAAKASLTRFDPLQQPPASASDSY